MNPEKRNSLLKEADNLIKTGIAVGLLGGLAGVVLTTVGIATHHSELLTYGIASGISGLMAGIIAAVTHAEKNRIL